MHVRIRRIIQAKGSDPRLGMRWTLAVGAVALCTTVGVAVAQRRPAEPEPRDAPPTKVFQEQREIEVREPPEADQQRIAMKRVLERLMKQADEKKEMLREGNDLSDDERRIQQIELKLLAEQIEQLKNRLEAPGRAPVKMTPREPLEPNFEAKLDSLRQEREELVQRAEKMKHELEGLRDDQAQEADELKIRLKETQAEIANAQKKLEAMKRAQADELNSRKLDELKRAQAKVRVEETVRKPAAEEQDREELLQNARLRAEKLARVLKENPDMDPEKATDMRNLLGMIRAEISALEQESRSPDGRKEAPDVAPKRRIIKEEVKIEKKAPDGPPRDIKGPAAGPRLEARVYALEHVRPERMQAIVEALIEAPETVSLPGNGRKVTVLATVENHYRIEKIARIIDVPEDEPNFAPDKHRVEEMNIIQLRYFSARRMQDVLRPMLGETGYAVADEQRHCLNVRTTQANMRRVQSIVRALDTPADGRISATEVEELRGQMRSLSEQMQQIQSRLDWMAEQEESGQPDKPGDRP